MFTKPAIDIDAQIALLRSRGLTITDVRHGFLLARTTRTRQRWRDGEGVLVHACTVTLPR